MAFGKSLIMKAIDREYKHRGERLRFRGPSRDRSLRGKARIKARKAANKRAAAGQWS